MRKLLIQPQARADLIEIWNFIAEQNPRAAEIVLQKLDDALRGLAAMPGKGHKRADAKDRAFRFWSVYSYIVAYRFDNESLTVVRVVHGRRNFRKLFPQKS